MENKLDVNFVKKVMRSVEPDIKPGETAIEYLKRTEAKRVHDMIMAGEAPRDGQYIEPIPGPVPAAPAAPKEVVFYEGFKLSRDFLTCVAVCMMKNPETAEILSAFGFDIKDLNGKPVVFTKPKKKAKSKKKK
jgi:hypothetical protein